MTGGSRATRTLRDADALLFAFSSRVVFFFSPQAIVSRRPDKNGTHCASSSFSFLLRLRSIRWRRVKKKRSFSSVYTSLRNKISAFCLRSCQCGLSLVNARGNASLGAECNHCAGNFRIPARARCIMHSRGPPRNSNAFTMSGRLYIHTQRFCARFAVKRRRI